MSERDKKNEVFLTKEEIAHLFWKMMPHRVRLHSKYAPLLRRILQQFSIKTRIKTTRFVGDNNSDLVGFIFCDLWGSLSQDGIGSVGTGSEDIKLRMVGNVMNCMMMMSAWLRTDWILQFILFWANFFFFKSKF